MNRRSGQDSMDVVQLCLAARRYESKNIITYLVRAYLFLDPYFSERPTTVEMHHHFEIEKETHQPGPKSHKLYEL